MEINMETIAQKYLTVRDVEKGYSVAIDTPKIQKTMIKSVGSLLITDLTTKTSYVVWYEELTPLHGSGVDDIYIIMSIVPTT